MSFLESRPSFKSQQINGPSDILQKSAALKFVFKGLLLCGWLVYHTVWYLGPYSVVWMCMFSSFSKLPSQSYASLMAHVFWHGTVDSAAISIHGWHLAGDGLRF